MVYAVFTPRCHSGAMDLSFARRRKAQPRAGTPDLQSLLSAAAARQSASPTARAAARSGAAGGHHAIDDPRVELFAPQGTASTARVGVASFAANSDTLLNPGKL